MPAKKRKNPFEQEAELLTKASDSLVFENAFQKCLAICAVQEVSASETIDTISTAGIKLVLCEFESGKSTNEVKVKAMADHLEAMKSLTAAEEHLRYSKERLRKMMATAVWADSSQSGNFKKEDLVNTLRFKLMARERAMVP